MRTLAAALIGVVLFPAAIANPERRRFPTVSADTVMLGEVRRASESAAAADLADSPETLIVERPAYAREGATAGVFAVNKEGVLLHRVVIRYGRASGSLIQVVSGLSPGERIVVSDMRPWDSWDRLQLKLP